MINFIKSLFSSPKYIVYKSDKNSNYYFNLLAKNGEVILTSEGYLNKDGVMNGVSSVSLHGKDMFNFEIRDSKDGKYYFVLKARNNKIIGTSEIYNSKSSASDGIESVISCCGTNVIKFDE